MISHIRGQRGSVTIIAIGTMILLGIFITSLLPSLSSIIKTNKMNQDRLQAQYAAEAGAKRAIASFGKLASTGVASDWSWIGVNTNVLGAGNAAGGVYTITINNGTNTTYTYTPASEITPGVFTFGRTYTLKAIGTFQQGNSPIASETIYVTVPINSGGDVNYSAISWNKSPK